MSPEQRIQGPAPPVPSTGGQLLALSCYPHHCWHTPGCLYHTCVHILTHVQPAVNQQLYSTHICPNEMAMQIFISGHLSHSDPCLFSVFFCWLAWIRLHPAQLAIILFFFMFLTLLMEGLWWWTLRMKMPLGSGDIEVPSYPNLACTRLWSWAGGLPSFIDRPFSPMFHLLQAVPASQRLANTWFSSQSCDQPPAMPTKQRQVKLRSQPDWRWKRRCNKYLIRPSGNFWRD